MLAVPRAKSQGTFWVNVRQTPTEGGQCDKLRPSCGRCRKTGLECSGYQQNLVWVSADQKTYRHNGRRSLEPGESYVAVVCNDVNGSTTDRTWQDHPVLSSLELDELIRTCDFDGEDVPDGLSCPPFSAFRVAPDSSWMVKSILDYGASFDVEDVSRALLGDASPSHSCLSFPGGSLPREFTEDLASPSSVSHRPTVEPESSVDFLQVSIPPPIRAENRLSQSDARLFNIYLTAVAPTLVPIHEARNPYLRYPAIALHLSHQEGKNYLLHALMALAAFCLVHKGAVDRDVMTALGTRLYSSAMAELRACILEDSADYVGLLTTMLTFLLLELSRGSSKVWRYHLQAAWRFLQYHQKAKSWVSSPEAWYVTQSCHLLKTGSESCGFVANDASDTDSPQTNHVRSMLSQELMSNPGYGWTMGTSSSIMETIASINTIAAQRDQENADDSTITVSLRLNQTLLKYQREVPPVALLRTTSLDPAKQDPQYLHLQAFQAATLIYHYQVCDRLSPRELSPLVSAVLALVSSFFEICGGTFAVWPVFVAAAEAYEEADKASFKSLLENAETVGMRNMSNQQTLLGQIWNARAVKAVMTNQEVADTWVDWREAMRKLDMDVPFV
ncbi:hypothetical protein PV08_05286 [Exophiala spinifera]|uniref:Zn(2)-C6 fungal-type domain-containing protein n=1 Tax=Exophiala spinifera TaxID=91928 RepID=A0A0D1YJT5_9EURO|nr:uncharacterized protein PV08_05286 [Exophiala spinifera]KIW15241.1 hypothetical protein PV08_05286 [Exophiala spinifera]